ncbi:peptidyl-tRNA hydrolase [Laetiporus sulphureus 93-53]|uniref:peptidyl-tRNA hydrolase n=1 Tax=Laetiporus sulphureus 93-53 TaxID=1314785 RepID=A0A165GSV4_9APHY|nr:peptidyl-tRNA hydrolase [Laetiporus sulphureus 93-53]KZT10764.1 peptidyl-tRNA hydrolase [Laetiporus sulphureus 93-53]
MGKNIVDITLYKPKALMNISGKPVAEALHTLSISPSETIVIHDYLDHRPMSVSPKSGGSAGGHNGIRSIIAALGNNMDFYRLRIGIGRDDTDPADYVLSPLSTAELEFWGPDGQGIDLVWKEVTKICAGLR